MHCVKLISKFNFFSQRKKKFSSSIFIIYVENLIHFIQKMTLKKVIDEVFDQNSKLLKSFNKKRIDKIVNLIIKQESSDSKDRRIQI